MSYESQPFFLKIKEEYNFSKEQIDEAIDRFFDEESGKFTTIFTREEIEEKIKECIKENILTFTSCNRITSIILHNKDDEEKSIIRKYHLIPCNGTTMLNIYRILKSQLIFENKIGFDDDLIIYDKNGDVIDKFNNSDEKFELSDLFTKYPNQVIPNTIHPFYREYICKKSGEKKFDVRNFTISENIKFDFTIKKSIHQILSKFNDLQEISIRMLHHAFPVPFHRNMVFKEFLQVIEDKLFSLSDQDLGFFWRGESVGALLTLEDKDNVYNTSYEKNLYFEKNDNKTLAELGVDNNLHSLRWVHWISYTGFNFDFS